MPRAQRRRDTDNSWQDLLKEGSQSAIAWGVATGIHHRDKDRRGRPYIQHPLDVGRRLLQDWPAFRTALAELGRSDIGLDRAFAIALCHDGPEKMADRVANRQKQAVVVGALRMMRDKGLVPPVVEIISALTYVPKPGMSPSDIVRGQAAKVSTVPGAAVLKTVDMADNLDPLRLYPYLDAAHTVHSVWKIYNLAKLLKVTPHGLRSDLSDLPPVVLALPGVAEILGSENSLEHPPRSNHSLTAELLGLPVESSASLRVRRLSGLE